MDNIMNKLKTTRILAAIGLALMFVSVFFPYESCSVTFLGYTSSVSISLYKYWEGYIVMLAVVADAVFMFKDYIEKYVPQMFNNGFAQAVKKANPKLAIIPPIVCAGVAIYLHANNSDVQAVSSLVKITYGFGFYALWLGAIATVVHIFLYKNDAVAAVAPAVNNNNNGGLNQFMGVNPAPAPAPMPEAPAAMLAPENVASDVKTCGTCGASCKGDAAFCVSCGNKF